MSAQKSSAPLWKKQYKQQALGSNPAWVQDTNKQLKPSNPRFIYPTTEIKKCIHQNQTFKVVSAHREEDG